MSRLLSGCWMLLAEPGVEADPAQRISGVVEFGQVLIGAAVLAKHEAVGVLRALAVEPRMRRQQRGTTLRWYMLRCAYGESIAQVYAAVALPWFLGDLGSEHIDRLRLTSQAFALLGIADAPAITFIREIALTTKGTRRSSAQRPSGPSLRC